MLSSMLASPLFPSFLDIYRLSTSSLWCMTLCIVISFLIPWSICLSSLVHFKNGPEYLTREIAQVFIPFIRFLLYSLVSSSFLVPLKFFLTSSLVWWCLFPIFPSIVYVSFSLSVLIFSWLGSSILSVIRRFPLFIISMVHFLCQIPSLCPDYILTAYIRASNSFPFLANSLMSSMYIWWLIFSCDEQSLFIARKDQSPNVSACVFPEFVVEWHHRHYK